MEVVQRTYVTEKQMPRTASKQASELCKIVCHTNCWISGAEGAIRVSAEWRRRGGDIQAIALAGAISNGHVFIRTCVLLSSPRVCNAGSLLPRNDSAFDDSPARSNSMF